MAGARIAHLEHEARGRQVDEGFRSLDLQLFNREELPVRLPRFDQLGSRGEGSSHNLTVDREHVFPAPVCFI
jgi:hypothetical protein